MQYRRFPRIPDCEISVLGFGLMRLPTTDGKTEHIDRKKTLEMIKEAYEAGVNYYDTAYPYHAGQSEVVLGSIIKELGIRDIIYIADKCPVWNIKKESDWETIFAQQLERLQTDYIDFYLMHALDEERWDTIKKFNGMQFLEQKKKEGKIRHIGFSFHATCDTFKKIIDEAQWEFCQIQFNYLDTNYQAGLEGIEYAAKRGIGIIAMEPLRGGLLANPPQGVTDIFASAEKPRFPAEWALRWVWENQHIVCALSGMGALDQVQLNCATASAARPNSLPQKQLAVVKKAEDWFKSRIQTPCTSCRYCMPCPSGVFIPEIFSEWNRQAMSGAFENGKKTAVSSQYKKLEQDAHGSDKCVRCGKCEKACPQHIAIIEKLAAAQKALTN